MKLSRLGALALLLLAPSARALRKADPAAGWNAYARLPEPLSGPLVVGADGKVFVISGNPTNGVPTAEVNAFDPASRAWSRRSSAPQAFGGAAAAVLDGLIYVAGGCVRIDCGYPTAAANTYDPKTDRWTPIPPLPETVWSGVGAALGGRFFVFGGRTRPMSGGGASTRVYAYDPRARAWSRMRDMPRAGVYSAGAVYNGRFVLIGGCTNIDVKRGCTAVTAEADAYDAAADTWSPFAALPVPRMAHAAIADGGRLIVAGGTSEEQVHSDRKTFILEPGAASWREGPALLRSRYFGSLFNLPRGVGMIGANQNKKSTAVNYYAEGLVESLGAPGPYIDADEEPAAPVAALPAAPVVESPAPSAPDADNPENLPAAAAPRPRAHAVVIGIERYREALPRADFAAGDARLTAEYFRRVLGVPEENLALLSDDRATKSDFEKYFERWLPNRVEAGDEVFVYFSGHGAPNPKTGESYLVPFDADPTYIDQTGYPLKRLYEVLAKLPAKRVVLVLDSCFSGAGGHSVIAAGARPLVTVVESGVPRPLIVITASGGDQISNSYQKKGHGLFTYFFLKGLKDKGEDLRAVYDYLKPQVARVARRELNADQDPQWRKGK